MIGWALSYAAIGWRVVPLHSIRSDGSCDCRRACGTPAKHPRIIDWTTRASADPAVVANWWKLWPDANIGALCGESFDAFDVEAAHLPAFTALAAKHPGSLGTTPTADTGRGGVHVLTAPTGIGAGRKLYLDGVHVGELKSAGGFIVVAPSVTVGQYTWRRAPAGMAAAAAPDWLRSLVAPARPSPKPAPWRRASIAPRSDLAPLVALVGRQAPGNRNAALFWAAGRAAGDGVPHDLAEQLLLDAYLEARQTGEPAGALEREGRATIRSAYSR